MLLCFHSIQFESLECVVCVVLVVLHLPFKHVMPADVKALRTAQYSSPLGPPAPGTKVTKRYVTFCNKYCLINPGICLFVPIECPYRM